jgi:hypothetical protein
MVVGVLTRRNMKSAKKQTKPTKVCSKWSRKYGYFGIEATYKLIISDARDAVVECYYDDGKDGEPIFHGWEYTVADGDGIEVYSPRLYKTPEEAMLAAEKALIKIMDDTISWAAKQKSKLATTLSKKKSSKELVK